VTSCAVRVRSTARAPSGVGAQLLRRGRRLTSRAARPVLHATTRIRATTYDDRERIVGSSSRERELRSNVTSTRTPRARRPRWPVVARRSSPPRSARCRDWPSGPRHRVGHQRTRAIAAPALIASPTRTSSPPSRPTRQTHVDLQSVDDENLALSVCAKPSRGPRRLTWPARSTRRGDQARAS